jgi:hypothetical protein
MKANKASADRSVQKFIASAVNYPQQRMTALLLLFALTLLVLAAQTARAQCGPDTYTPVVTYKNVRGKQKRIVRKAKKPYEAFADYKFDMSGRVNGGQVFDRFGEVSWCDQAARLDNFAMQLQNIPGSTGYIIVYGPQNNYETRARAAAAARYLVNNRGIDPGRIKTVNGGERSELMVELRTVSPY